MLSSKLSLPSLVGFGLLGLGLLACDEETSTRATPSGRSNGVLATPGATPVNSSPTGSPPTPSADAAKKAPRKGPLCGATNVRPLPTERISGLGTRSLPFAGGALPLGSLTWVNLWAAWCEPCKKELPLLQTWKKELAKKGITLELVFVSIDDDKRQLAQFLEKNGSGLGATYWLEEGNMRDVWLKKAELPQDPRLPVHLVVSPTGDVFCQIDGAIEESDLPEVEKMLTAAR